MYNNYKDKLINFYNRDRRMPTYTEMMSLFGFKSKNAVARLVDKFIEEGIVSKDHLGRLVADVSFNSIPMLGYVKAGFPSDVSEQLNDTINIDNYLINKKENSYMLTVDGDSMIDAHIANGDMVLVEKTNTAKDGQIVIADVDGEFTMKYFKKNGNKIWLEPANKDFKPIHPKVYLNITARVIAVIRKY
jgi:SOS regulatory protein LexA